MNKNALTDEAEPVGNILAWRQSKKSKSNIKADRELAAVKEPVRKETQLLLQ